MSMRHATRTRAQASSFPQRQGRHLDACPSTSRSGASTGLAGIAASDFWRNALERGRGQRWNSTKTSFFRTLLARTLLLMQLSSEQRTCKAVVKEAPSVGSLGESSPDHCSHVHRTQKGPLLKQEARRSLAPSFAQQVQGREDDHAFAQAILASTSHKYKYITHLYHTVHAVQVYMYVRTFVCMHACMHVCKHAYVYTYVYIYIEIYILMCVYIYTIMYTHM